MGFQEVKPTKICELIQENDYILFECQSTFIIQQFIKVTSEVFFLVYGSLASVTLWGFLPDQNLEWQWFFSYSLSYLINLRKVIAFQFFSSFILMEGQRWLLLSFLYTGLETRYQVYFSWIWAKEFFFYSLILHAKYIFDLICVGMFVLWNGSHFQVYDFIVIIFPKMDLIEAKVFGI